MNTDSTAQDKIAAYVRDGERMAYQLGNRGPMKFDANGTVDKRFWMPTGITASTCSRAA